MIADVTHQRSLLHSTSFLRGESMPSVREVAQRMRRQRERETRVRSCVMAGNTHLASTNGFLQPLSTSANVAVQGRTQQARRTRASTVCTMQVCFPCLNVVHVTETALTVRRY